MSWVNGLGRPFSGTDFLCAKGFVFNERTSSYGASNPFADVNQQRTRVDTIHMAGNSMNVHAVGLPLLWLSPGVRRKSDISGSWFLQGYLTM